MKIIRGRFRKIIWSALRMKGPIFLVFLSIGICFGCEEGSWNVTTGKVLYKGEGITTLAAENCGSMAACQTACQTRTDGCNYVEVQGSTGLGIFCKIDAGATRNHVFGNGWSCSELCVPTAPSEPSCEKGVWTDASGKVLYKGAGFSTLAAENCGSIAGCKTACLGRSDGCNYVEVQGSTGLGIFIKIDPGAEKNLVFGNGWSSSWYCDGGASDPTEPGYNCTVLNPCINMGHCVGNSNGSFKECECNEGCQGLYCHEPIPVGDECTKECFNGGTCVSDQIDGNRCECPTGWISPSCKVKTEACQSFGCMNGGTCFAEDDGTLRCKCPAGYTGDRCERSHCVGITCSGIGTCRRFYGGIVYCACPRWHQSSYIKANGKISDVHCIPNHPCGGQPCSVQPRTRCERAGRKDFKCHCADPTKIGNSCSELHPCHKVPVVCQNRGVCKINGTDKDKHICSCPPNVFGLSCENRCPCQNGGKCYPNWPDRSGYRCACPLTHTGKHCEVLSSCKNNGYLHTDAQGRKLCHCRRPFHGEFCEKEGCADNCNGGLCEWKMRVGAIPASASCKCPDGSQGLTCPPLPPTHPCNAYPCKNGGLCRISSTDPNGYSCDCRKPFYGDNCEITPWSICSCYNDPHCRTFDGSRIEPHGSCRIIVSKTCTEAWPRDRLHPYQIWMENRPCGGATCVDRVGFEIANTEIVMDTTGIYVDEGDGRIPLFSDELPWPQNRPELPIQVMPYPCSPTTAIMLTYIGKPGPDRILPILYLVLYPGHAFSVIPNAEMRQLMGKNVCGMCSNSNGDRNDDFHGGRTPTLKFIKEIVQTPKRPDEACEPVGAFSLYYLSHGIGRKKRSLDNEGCSSPEERAKAEELCGIINDPSGPFGVCYEKNPDREHIYQNCIIDVCVDRKFRCRSLLNYAESCGQYGEPGNWRAVTKCSKSCPRGMKLSRCVNVACQESCQNREPCQGQNEGACSEGCVCDEGTIWDQKMSKCVDPAVCDMLERPFESRDDLIAFDPDFLNRAEDDGISDGPGNPTTSGPSTTKEKPTRGPGQGNPFTPPKCSDLGPRRLENSCRVGEHCLPRGGQVIFGQCAKRCTCRPKGLRCRDIARKPMQRRCKACMPPGEKEPGQCPARVFYKSFYDPPKAFPCENGITDFGPRGKSCQRGKMCFAPGTVLIRGPCQRRCVCGESGEIQCNGPPMERRPRMKKRCQYCLRNNQSRCPMVFLMRIPVGKPDEPVPRRRMKLRRMKMRRN